MTEIPLPIYFVAPNGRRVGEISMGGAEGTHVASLWLYNGDILNVRNLQGGFKSGDTGDLNLDIGGGSTEDPGNVVVNFDVGKGFEVFDGEKRRAFTVRRDPNNDIRRIRSYEDHYFHKRAFVPDGRGGWRRL